MTRFVISIVVVGVGLTLIAGISRGFDSRSAATLAFICVFGVLGIAVARKASRGEVLPATCSHCGGVISPGAPYCKHCREPL